MAKEHNIKQRKTQNESRKYQDSHPEVQNEQIDELSMSMRLDEVLNVLDNQSFCLQNENEVPLKNEDLKFEEEEIKLNLTIEDFQNLNLDAQKQVMMEEISHKLAESGTARAGNLHMLTYFRSKMMF